MDEKEALTYAVKNTKVAIYKLEQRMEKNTTKGSKDAVKAKLEIEKVKLKALGKMICMKPIILFENEKEAEWKCPVCHTNITHIEEKPCSDYCHECGQAFEWGDI